jgi:hypothetical protein
MHIFTLIIGSMLFFPVSCTVGSVAGYVVIVKKDQRDVSRGDTVHEGFRVVAEKKVQPFACCHCLRRRKLNRHRLQTRF